MEYCHVEWTIQQLIKIYDNDQIDLCPSYQRNPIWSSKAQKSLMHTILSDQPIPNFFVLQVDKNKYEMVDGQQRARAIIGFSRGLFSNIDGEKIDSMASDPEKSQDVASFYEYKLNITKIVKIEPDESIEKFYALVNSSGLRLNKPELKKAEYYNTKFLQLVTTICNDDDFSDLRLFTASSINRMNDIDFASELMALIKYGISDKKDQVERIFSDDINDEEFKTLHAKHKQVMGHLLRFNTLIPLFKTRYRQRNDFYTLYSFLLEGLSLRPSYLDHFYKLLVKLDPHIRPSQEKCDPLKQYALHCVTQSNSKNARLERKKFFDLLLLNPDKQANDVQTHIIKYFRAEKDTSLTNMGGYTTLNPEALNDPNNLELQFG